MAAKIVFFDSMILYLPFFSHNSNTMDALNLHNDKYGHLAFQAQLLEKSAKRASVQSMMWKKS